MISKYYFMMDKNITANALIYSNKNKQFNLTEITGQGS